MFSVSTGQLWDALPIHIRKLPTVESLMTNFNPI